MDLKLTAEGSERGRLETDRKLKAAQAELSALREEWFQMKMERNAAEQRNAELVELLREAVTIPYKDGLLSRITAALKPTESGASE